MVIEESFNKIINSLTTTDKTLLQTEINQIRDYFENQSSNNLVSKSNDNKSLLDFKELQLSQIIDSAPAAISFIDLEFTYIFTNQGYKNWFGKNLDGFKVHDFVGMDHFNQFGKKYLTEAFKGKSVQKELVIDTNGKIFHLMVTYAPAQDIDNNIIGAYVFAIETNHLKETEQALVAKNEELQQYIDSYLQLENFSHIASHDLKAPLKNVISFAELLRKNASEKLNEQELKFLGFIQSSARNMQSTIKGLLDFSLLSNQKPVFEEVSPKEIFDNLTSDLKTILSQKNAIININSKSLPDKMIADHILFRQLVQNLILNAIKFCKEDQPIVEITCKETEKYIWFYVKDNGIGIKNEYLQKIFAVFTKLHDTEKYEGTGIGLALAKKIIQHHNGDLHVKSKEGHGSTFYFSICKCIRETIDEKFRLKVT